MIFINADGLQDGLYNVKNGQIFKYKAKGGTVRTYEMGEVVKCKDCIHKENWDAHIDRWWCKVHRGYFADDYFCADGREDGEE